MYRLVSMTNHCETTTLIVLINLNKLDLANVCTHRRTSPSQLMLGSEVFKKSGKVLIYQEYLAGGGFKELVHA